MGDEAHFLADRRVGGGVELEFNEMGIKGVEVDLEGEVVVGAGLGDGGGLEGGGLAPGLMLGGDLFGERGFIGETALVFFGGGEVVLFCVLANSAVRAENGSETKHALADARDPGARDILRVSLVKLRDNLLLEKIVELKSLFGVPFRVVAMLLTVAEGPTEIGGVGFSPPAVEFGEVEPSIDKHLHAARAASLPRTARRVDPNIDTLYEFFCHEHVIIAKKDDVGANFGAADKMDPLLNERPAWMVCRMGFARKDELDRSFRMHEKTEKALRVGKKHVGPLISGKTSGETES